MYENVGRVKKLSIAIAEIWEFGVDHTNGETNNIEQIPSGITYDETIVRQERWHY